MNEPIQNAVTSAKLAGYTCIAQHAVELTNQHKCLMLPGEATARSFTGKNTSAHTLTVFTFEDGSELTADISFSGNRIDAYWSTEAQGPDAKRVILGLVNH